LPGLIAIGVWTIYNLFYERQQLRSSFLSLAIALLISVPWQIYCCIKYTSLFLSELTFNVKHFSEPLEGHTEVWYYHLEAIRELYANNDLIFFAIGFALLYLAFSKKTDLFFKFIFLLSIFLVYLFFSVAKTKMPAFCMIVIPLIIISIIFFICALMEKIRNSRLKNLAYFILIPQMLIFFLSPGFFIKKHTVGYKPDEELVSRGLKEKEFILNLIRNSDRKTVFLNTYPIAVKIMFYSDHEACNWPVSKKTIDILKSQNYKIVAVNSHLPDYILKDAAITKIPSYEKETENPEGFQLEKLGIFKAEAAK
jgi:hypothetical protein